jgi:hypothetical protein
MVETNGTSSMSKMLLAFVGILVLVHAAFAGIAYFFPDLEMPNSMGIIFLTIAAISAGQVFAKDSGRAMTSGEKFKFAVLGTILGLALAIGVVWAYFVYFGVPFTISNVLLGLTNQVTAPGDLPMYLLIVGGVAALTSLLVCYFGSGAGAKMHLKQMAKLAAKGK